MSRNYRRPPSWPDLPSELLVTITNLLKPRAEISNVRAACKKWRSAVPPPVLELNPDLPETISVVIDDENAPLPFLNSEEPFTVAASTVFLLHRHSPTASSDTCTPWLVAVEQSTPDKLRLLHPLTRTPINDLPKNFPQILRDNFRATEISRGFNLKLSDDITNVLKDNASANKVIFWPHPRNGYNRRVMVLYSDGDLVSVIYTTGRYSYRGWRTVTHSRATKFQDIIKWRDMILALDRFGRLYGIEFDTLKVNTILANNPTFKGYSWKHMRLLESNDDIYLIVRKYGSYKFQFSVYKLDMKSHEWTFTKNIGDRILFVTFDTCFFVQAQDLLPGFRGNCVVFPKQCFPVDERGDCKVDEKLFQGASHYFAIGISYLSFINDFKLITSCPGFPDVLWPPPSWIWDCSGESQPTAVDSSLSGGKNSSLRAISGDDVLLRNDFLLEELFQNDHSDLPLCQEHVSKVEFQGLRIKAEVLPVLKAMWAKHGSLIGDSTIRSKAVLVSALESMAEVIELLEETTGRSLTDSQAANLSSIMFDLKYLGLKVDWLVPSVEKALELHKSRPLLESLAALNKEIAEVDEREKLFLAESAEKKRELVAKIMSLSTKISFAEPTVLDD